MLASFFPHMVQTRENKKSFVSFDFVSFWDSFAHTTSMLGEKDDTPPPPALSTAAEDMTLLLDDIDGCSGFTSTSTVELRVDPADGNPYSKESFLQVYGNDAGHHRWAAAPVFAGGDMHLGEPSSPSLCVLASPSWPTASASKKGTKRKAPAKRFTQVKKAAPKAKAPAPAPPALPCPPSPTQFAVASGMPINNGPLFCRLLPIASFTEEHVFARFAPVKISKRKFERMEKVHHLWHRLHDHGIADFTFDGALNVWGFHSVHVVDRKNWNEYVLATGRGMARGFKGGVDAKHPVQSIYEIIQYCSTQPMRCKRDKKTHHQDDVVDKKALHQDKYVFDEKAFEKQKLRAGGW